jgi:hypothetical protein
MWAQIIFTNGISISSYIIQGEDAEDFNPDRFIDENGQLIPPISDTRDGMSVNYIRSYSLIEFLPFPHDCRR